MSLLLCISEKTYLKQKDSLVKCENIPMKFIINYVVIFTYEFNLQGEQNIIR